MWLQKGNNWRIFEFSFNCNELPNNRFPLSLIISLMQFNNMNLTQVKQTLLRIPLKYFINIFQSFLFFFILISYISYILAWKNFNYLLNYSFFLIYFILFFLQFLWHTLKYWWTPFIKYWIPINQTFSILLYINFLRDHLQIFF
jgi:hypothetical protein